jgi:hypothetical protein
MPGSSFLYGPLACSNARYIFPDKPKTVTLDAEVYLGRDDNDSMSVMLAVLHYFIPLGAIVPDEDSLYLVGGKIASITSNTPIGDGYDTATYDIEIEAVFVSCFCLLLITFHLFNIIISLSSIRCQTLLHLHGQWSPLQAR